ncbi:MAG: ABC transporter ATP-binding protein [Candidatus Bipolaricaulia bacterium]
MKEILKYLWRYRWRMILGVGALLALDAGQLVIPLIIRRVVDQLSLGISAHLLRYAAYIVGIALGVTLLRFLWRLLIIGASRRIERDLRDRLYGHLLTLSTDFFHRTKTGDLMAHATNDIDAVRMACGFGVLALADALIMVSFSLAAMTYINPTLTGYAFIPLPFITLVVSGFGRVIHRRFEAIQETFARLTEQVRENLAGIRIIKTFVQERGAEQEFGQVNEAFVRKNMSLVRVWGAFDPLIALLAGSSTVIILWLGGRAVITGGISLGDFVAFITYLGLLAWPMMALGWVVNLVQRGTASMNRITRILEVVPTVREVERPRRFPEQYGIEFTRLSFTYPDRTPALQEIDLEVGAGTVLGVVGLTGSGKSTIAHLILRVFDPPEGSVWIGGVDVTVLRLDELRRRVGIVPQDPFLFSTTIRENIAFGQPQASEAEIITAAKLAGIYDEIMAFPDGFDTQVGERGVTLSGGQKQRVAIARALLRDPEILILDDPLSAVDAEKERLILENLRAVLRARTSIVIAHRVSAVQNADQIVVLDQGRIIERGTHRELIAYGGLYNRFYQLQKAEEELRVP